MTTHGLSMMRRASVYSLGAATIVAGPLAASSAACSVGNCCGTKRISGAVVAVTGRTIPSWRRLGLVPEGLHAPQRRPAGLGDERGRAAGTDRGRSRRPPRGVDDHMSAAELLAALSQLRCIG